jgi:hypothetical protein
MSETKLELWAVAERCGGLWRELPHALRSIRAKLAPIWELGR